MKATLIRNGHIIDPANARDEIGDLWIVEGCIGESIEHGREDQGVQRAEDFVYVVNVWHPRDPSRNRPRQDSACVSLYQIDLVLAYQAYQQTSRTYERTQQEGCTRRIEVLAAAKNGERILQGRYVKVV